MLEPHEIEFLERIYRIIEQDRRSQPSIQIEPPASHPPEETGKEEQEKTHVIHLG